MGAAFWDMAFGLKREMDAGTLEPTWLTPTRPETMVLGRAISGGILSAIASVILVAVGALVFGADLAAGMLAGLPALVLASISMIGIGYLVASAVLMIREPNFMVDATNFIFAMLSGVAFPITVLPPVIQPICYLLPTTYAIDLLRVLRTRHHAAAAAAGRVAGAGRARAGHDPGRALDLPADRAPHARAGHDRPALIQRPASNPVACGVHNVRRHAEKPARSRRA